MAARKNRGTKDKGLPEEWKNKIRATQIMNRLVDCINGDVELSSQQLKAADIVLKKILPDLARQDLQQLDADGNPADATNKIEVVFVKADTDTGSV